MNLHQSIQSQFNNALEKNNVSHAILLQGKTGYGTLLMAHWLAKRLICNHKSESCEHKVDNFQHADYHFCYTITSTDSVKKPTTDSFRKDWVSFNKENPVGNVYDWVSHIGAEKKQGIINADQALEVMQKLNLRSYEGGNKVMLIWNAESMNTSFANKILKILEEPPKDTYFILISENPEELLTTIISRCQRIQIPRLSNREVAEVLKNKYSVESERAEYIASESEGDMNIALEKLDSKTEEFEELFIDWVRSAFMAKTKLSALKKIYDWSITINEWKSREKQKQFLEYCSNIFRQALLQNYGTENLVNKTLDSNGFKWEVFSKYIHGANIALILEEINTAAYHIERNGNDKLIFLDLGIKMTRHLHTYEPKIKEEEKTA